MTRSWYAKPTLFSARVITCSQVAVNASEMYDNGIYYLTYINTSTGVALHRGDSIHLLLLNNICSLIPTFSTCIKKNFKSKIYLRTIPWNTIQWRVHK